MVIKISKPPYSEEELRNYDTSRQPTFLGQFFHDKAVEFQRKEKELALRKGKYDINHCNNAKRFFKQLQSVTKIPQKEKKQAVWYAVVTLEDAAIMCGIDAYKLWNDYVKRGILPMHDGNVPAAEFLKVTVLLKNVIGFFSEQERIRRRYESSYKEIIKYVITEYVSKGNDNATPALDWLSFYFNMSEKDAVGFESATTILYHFFEMKSLRNPTLKEEGSIINTPTDEATGEADSLPQEAVSTIPTEENHNDMPGSEEKKHVICVPRGLWEGKAPATIRDGMRKAGYDDCVIAHVLYEWREEKNNKRIGELLFKPKNPDYPGRGRSDDALRDRSKKLRKEATAFTITTD